MFPEPRRRYTIRHFAGSALAVGMMLWAGAGANAETKKIKDNSFLLEEAYNQEAGVVQHALLYQQMRDHTWGWAFSQEWPLGAQDHQLSYSIPSLHPEAARAANGLGDIAVNYRYQVTDKGPVAFAPRVSILLPTGKAQGGLGMGHVGYQFNLPLSLELSDTWVTHWNAGATFAASHASSHRPVATGYSGGMGVVWLLHERVNFMLETSWTASAMAGSGAGDLRETLYVSPGLRFSIERPSGLEIVPGIAFPIGVGPSKGDVGILFYISVEHPFS